MELLTAAFKAGWSNVIIHVLEKKGKREGGKKRNINKGKCTGSQGSEIEYAVQLLRTSKSGQIFAASSFGKTRFPVSGLKRAFTCAFF